MIEREGWHFTLMCDHCEHIIENFDDFDAAVKYKKTHGWRSVKGITMWFEFCPNCSTTEIMNSYRSR